MAGGRLRSLVQLLRPKHWAKNVFVLMPLPFCVAQGAQLRGGVLLLGLAAFCLANSAVYAFNDARDAAADRLHATKRLRPVAAELISEWEAYLWSAGLAVIALAVLFWIASPLAGGLCAIYLTLNLYYCLDGKNRPLVDVFVLSSGFVIRVWLGCALVATPPSNWLLLCTSMLALFLAFAKRRGDLVRGLDEAHRQSLAGYNRRFLDHSMTISAALTLIAYALYCIDAGVLLSARALASFPFVAFGVFDYLRLVHVEDRGDSPVEMITSSPELYATGLGWFAAIAWGLGWIG